MSLDHNASLRDADPIVARLIDRELRRQQHGLELIASENFASRAVIDAMGTPLTNKYAEGYPGRRYYGGCEVVDEVEQLAIDRLKQLFGAEHANVQPHSGAQANFAAFMARHQAGRHHHGHVAAARRPSLARRGGQPQRRDLARRALRRGSGHRPHRLRRGARAGQAGAAQAHHRGRQRLCPHHRLRRRSARSPTRSARSSWWTWRTSRGWWRAASIRRRCRTRRSSPAPRTRRCAGRAPASSSRSPSTPRRSTSRCSPARRADRSST